MNVNKLTGAQFFDARTSLGMSISSVAKFTDMNRNTLSQFEKEKATLTLTEKKKLVSLYEERGYDFEQMDQPTEDVLLESVEHSKRTLSQSEPKEVGARMIELMDEFSDLMTLTQRPKAQSEGLQFHGAIEDNKETLSLLNDYQKLDKTLIEHLNGDLNGETKGKVGLIFGDDGEARGEKLLGLMALQHLRTLAAQNPELVQLRLQNLSDKDTDNHRMLKRLATVFDYNSLKLDDVSSELVK